jgi:hypothetical protein
VNTRRDFLEKLGYLGFIAGTVQLSLSCSSKNIWPEYRIASLTRGPKNHFFGYYGICPWNKSQTHLLSLETNFQDHMPNSDESAVIGLVDAKTGRYERITETLGWNFQQGAFMHWNPLNPDSEILYNDRIDNKVVSVFLDIHTGRKRILPRPVNGISHNGKYALSLTYGRLGRMRKVVGYSGMKDPNVNEPYPDDDGVFLLDLHTGESKLIVSIARVNEILLKRGLDLKGSHMWFNHVVFNKSDSRLFFLARAWRPDHLPKLRNLATGMFTVNTDGSNLLETIPFEYGVSHFEWRNDEEIIATFQDVKDNYRFKHYIFKDGSGKYRLLGDGELNFDGHCTFSPDQKWIATDRKMKETLEQSLILFNFETDSCKTLATLSMKEKMFISGELRCDFHPRWNRDGTEICFDALDSGDGSRQLHVAYLE